MSDKKIKITYQALFFSMNTVGKLLHNATNDKHSYWINKLTRKLQVVQNKLGPQVQKFLDDLSNEYAEKDEKGKPIVNNGAPKVPAEKREEYDSKREAYLEQTVEVDADKLPVEYFAHIQKTPIDWELIGQLADVTPASLDDGKPQMPNLHALPGGH